MIAGEGENRERSSHNKSMPVSQSSSENDQKRERFETSRRRELSTKYELRQPATAKSFKSTRKKEDGSFLRAYLSSQSLENQVPLSDARRYLPRREGNKTDSGNGNNEEVPDATSPKDPVVVRETRASRLRAATRTSMSDFGSPSPKSSREARKPEKEKITSSGSPTYNSLNRKDIDKSHTRKSHLNRSHTSEGVYEDVYVPGSSNFRRRGAKTCSLESSPVKNTDKFLSSRSTMGNSNGTLKDASTESLPRTSQLSRNSFNKKASSILEKCSPLSLAKRRDWPSKSVKSSPEHSLDSLERRPFSVENSPARRLSVDKSKQIDVAARAEILAASTLKMINRLDEINSKTRRIQEDAERGDVSSKKAFPFNSVISSSCKKNYFIENNPEIQKKVPVLDENTATSSSIRRSRLRQDVKPKIEATKKVKPEPKVKADSTTTTKPILKNRPSISIASSSDAFKSTKPVSILKRKSLSQDETYSSPPPPVTFSPSVLKKEGADAKRQGILKKRRSLDENEVMRRRSYSPDASFSDFKSILKNQRRSSMEELTRRSHSPDSTPQGILKRKSSKEETEEAVSSTQLEPQGILKRKSFPWLSNTHQHVKISDSVILATAAGIKEIQVCESVRPILKKKSSSEEHSASELSLTEVPKSILKKKTSLETDDTEEKPKKPILKTSRAHSFEEPEDGAKRGRGFVCNAADPEPVKPILKRENSRSKIEDECGSGENGVVLRRDKSKRQDRPYSSSDIDSELSAIFLKRRSLEFQPVSAINFDWENQKTKKASSNERLRGEFWRRPLSVAEKIINLENFLEVERLERERRNSPPGSPSNLSPGKLSSDSTSLSSSGAVPRRSVDSIHLQLPLGFGGTSSRQSTSPDNHTFLDEKPVAESSTFFSLSTRRSSLKSCTSDAICDLNPCSSSPGSQTNKFTSESINYPDDATVTDQLFTRTSFHSTDSDQASRYDTDCCVSVDSLEEKVSSLSLQDPSFSSCSEVMDAKNDTGLFLLQRTGSVSAKTSLFREMEMKFKDDEKTKKVVKGTNAGINRRHEKKLLESNGQRYHTQPVSSEEVELAVRKSKSTTSETKEDEGEKHEDELSTMSYLDRLRMFESTFIPERPVAAGLRKREARFKTQPVTTTEVETAKSLRLTSKASDEDSHGLSTSKMLKNLPEPSTNISKPLPKAIGEEKSKPKGILKNLNQNIESKEEYRLPSSDSESDDCEKKGGSGILKNELSESFRNLKKVLKKVEKETGGSKLKGILKQPSSEKKATSSSEEESVAGEGDRQQKRNLAAILQKVEPVGSDRVRKPGHGMPSYLQNTGIAREISKLRNTSSVVKSQSHSSVASVFRPPVKAVDVDADAGRESSNGEAKDQVDDSSLRVAGSALRRSTTQPLAPSETGPDDDMSGASIRERLARLKRSGELDWQKRKSHVSNLEDELSVITAANYLFNEHCLIRDKNRSVSPQRVNGKQGDDLRNSSLVLADRLGKLDAAKDGWKKRIKPSDAIKFSVEGKMMEKMESLSPPNITLQISPNRTPLAERKKRSPKAAKFRSKQCNPSLSSVPSSPLERINNPIARSVSAPGSGKDGLFSLSAAEEISGPVVTVPKTDDETFTSFFDGLSTERVLSERLDIKDEDLDIVTQMKSSQLLVLKRNIKTQKRRATVKNPVKALAARLNLQEYTEVKTGIAEKELKRLKIEKAARNSNMAIEALAGLASQEDFTAINLKKASEGLTFPDAPYKDLMLLQVKGRRHVQTRLIEPKAENINAGDCYVLVTPNKVFHYVGEFANVIEKSRGAEISSHIQQKGDLGCTAGSVITIGEGGRANKEQIKEFWNFLGGDPSCEKAAGNVDEDELFESALVDTNMIYEMVNDELVPNEEYWGSIPKIEVLDPNKVLVFDFGSEFYVWNGKNVNLSQRKVALKLAKELWEEGFDYSECDVCPLTFASRLGAVDASEEVPDTEKAGPIRPNWALFAKITQNMETVLFREKFIDWPDYSRVIRRSKKIDGNDEADTNGSLELKPCDAKAMLENVVPEPDLMLEGNHLGRGVSYFDEETRRCSEISTHDVTVWHISEYEYSELPQASVGQFHMEDSYVVRWHYVITITGRELSGQPSKHLTTGRNRYAYFFWQGNDSHINDKGAAACLTVELDKEHGPQVRVVQGLEPPAFLNLFGGKMVVHSGKRCSEDFRDVWRLFICRGVADAESVLIEVPCSMRQLRSAASFVIVNRIKGKIIVWHGWKSPEHVRKNALSAAQNIQTFTPKEFAFETEEISVREETEGSESQDFKRAVGGDNRQLYYSLLENKCHEVTTPRLFHLTSVSGEFHFTELVSPYFAKDITTPFPFLQSDLYLASQPALFLLDAGDSLWLWQGWWEENSENERGSGYIRFQAERRAAMSSAMSYWSLKHGNASPKAYLVWAGLEPLQFTNQFPFWNDRDEVTEINMKDGKKPGEAIPVRTEFASLTQSTYPLAQLQNRPLPDGVNPTTLEDYLESQCFPDLFGIEKEEFLKMPGWKKKKLKQEAGLF